MSSTFADLEAERDVLQSSCFPALREFCASRGARFQPIDLRWGVTEEAGLDQRTVAICLDEIDRCRRTTPRPNFVLLLGDRYGWRPLPPRVRAREFEAIASASTRSGARALARWYELDENAVPPEYVLRPRRGRFADPRVWAHEEANLRTILARAAATAVAAPRRWKYEASATEYEVERGVAPVADAAGHAFGFFRTIRDLPSGPAASGFRDLRGEDIDADALKRLEGLKRRLRRSRMDIREYEVAWRGDGPGSDHLPALALDVRSALWNVISSQLKRLDAFDPLEEEAAAHWHAARERSTPFVGRRAPREAIAEVLRSERTPLAIAVGPSGSGKSALLSRVAIDARDELADAVVVLRLVGATPASSEVRSFLDGLSREIARRYGADEAAIPPDLLALVEGFRERLALATPERPLVLVIDALDQLAAAPDPRALAWLPARLPTHVHVVVSTLPGEWLAAARQRFPGALEIPLEPMRERDGARLLAAWLRHAGRRVNGPQRSAVLRAFSPEGLPLHLRLLFEEARRWSSTLEPPELPADAAGMASALFRRLERDPSHGEVLVGRSVGYLVAARDGLSEDELVAVLSGDSAVMREQRRRSPLSPRIDELPFVVWSRLAFELRPYLSERSSASALLLGFFHRGLADAARAQYAAGRRGLARHRALARFFARQPLFVARGDARAPNLRRLAELPYQQTGGALWSDLRTTLTDFAFLETKAASDASGGDEGVEMAYGGPYLLLDDFDRALARWPRTRPGRDLLAALGAALSREAHVLARHPELTWQQLHNRLQWLPGEPAALAQRERDGRSTGRPWLHLRTAPRESTALIRTLSGHDRVAAFAVSHDERLLVSTGFEGDIRIWDVPSGVRLLSLDGHIGPVWASAFSADGRAVVSGGEDGTVRIWDAASGAEFARLEGHESLVTACAFALGDEVVVSASDDSTVRVWDAATGHPRHVCRGHEKRVRALAVGDASGLLASAGDDAVVCVWDVASGDLVHRLTGHSQAVRACALSVDGRMLVSGGEDAAICVWSPGTGELERVITTGCGPIATCALAPDGSYVVAGGTEPRLEVWDPSTGRRRAVLVGHECGISDCAVSPDGGSILSADSCGGVRLWDPATRHARATLYGHAQDARRCGFGASGLVAVSASLDGSVRLWDARARDERPPPAFHVGGVTGCRFSADGAVLVTSGRDGLVATRDPATADVIETMDQHFLAARDCAVAPDRSFVASVSDDGALKLWSPPEGRVRTLEDDGAGLLVCAVAPDASFVATGSETGWIVIWGRGSNEPRARAHAHASPVTACTVLPDGSAVVSAGEDGVLELRDPETGVRRALLEGHDGPVWDCAASGDADFLVSAGGDSTARVWDARTGALRGALRGHEGRVLACAVAPDSRRIASVGEDATVRLWDAHRRRLDAVLEGHGLATRVCAFSPDGRLVASGGDDRTVRLWSVPEHRQLALLPVAGRPSVLAFHSSGRRIAYGDEGGGLYVAELAGSGWPAAGAR